MKSIFETIQEQACEKSMEMGYGSIQASCIRSRELMRVTAITEADTHDMLVTLYTYRVDGMLVTPDEIEARLNGSEPAMVAGEL